MNLGIVVVYLVPETYEAMLALHLRQIARYTHVPDTIFGCATRLSSGASRILKSDAHVKLCACEPPEGAGGGVFARSSAEHSHYLDQLTRIAMDSGVTHVVTLHVDSFPLRSDWIEYLLTKLSAECPFVTGTGIDTGCMMFTREFYLRCRPAFLSTEAERRRPEYSRFLDECNPVQHSGIGYAFQAYVDGRSGYYLRPRAWASQFASVYDDRVFHLHWGLRAAQEPAAASWLDRSGGSVLTAAGHVARVLVPRWAARVLRRRIGAKAWARVDEPRFERAVKPGRQEMRKLLADPDNYLDRLGIPGRSDSDAAPQSVLSRCSSRG